MKTIIMTLSVMLLTMSCTKKVESEVSKTKETNRYVRLWTDTENDTYLRMDLDAKTIDYYPGGMFASRVAICEKALWMTVNQINQLRTMKDKDAPNTTIDTSKSTKRTRPPRRDSKKSK